MAKAKEPTFTKEALVKSERYKDKRDLVNALLEDGQRYTLELVDKIIDEYMNKEVN